MKDQSRTQLLCGEQSCTINRRLRWLEANAMRVVIVGWPAGVTIFRVVNVDRFAILVLAMGACPSCELGADMAPLLVTTLTNDRLTIVGNNFAFNLAFLLLHYLGGSHMDANTR